MENIQKIMPLLDWWKRILRDMDYEFLRERIVNTSGGTTRINNEIMILSNGQYYTIHIHHSSTYTIIRIPRGEIPDDVIGYLRLGYGHFKNRRENREMLRHLNENKKALNAILDYHKVHSL